MNKEFSELDINEKLNDLSYVCGCLRSKIYELHPQHLIGGLWTKMMISLMEKFHDEGNSSLPNVSAHEKNILFAMEYVHATIASDGIKQTEPLPVSEDEVDELLVLSEQAIAQVFQYNYASLTKQIGDVDPKFLQLQHIILSNWVLMRGKRYQTMEEEFFNYVLRPHDAILCELYGMGSDELTREIQVAISAMREGLDRARNHIHRMMEKVPSRAADSGVEIQDKTEVFQNFSSEDRDSTISALDDAFFGGVFNVSKHTKIPDLLLKDLSFEPAEEVHFFDGTKYSGTPLQTLPARIKPLLRLGEDYFCTDPSIVRDELYRSLQRAIIKRKPEYREIWNQRQKSMSEAAFSELMSCNLKYATVLTDVYYPIGKKRWAETDGVIILDDVLVCLEVKAGTEAYAAPSRNIKSHVNKIEELVVNAYKQVKRFLDYVYGAKSAPLYKKSEDGKYVEVARIRSSELRKIYPIGLTVEAFTPYSSVVNERDDIEAIAGKHNFISMSLDDLMVMKKLFRGTGEFFHYLDVRQALAGMKGVMIFDELDHLGGYISNNRMDQWVQQQLGRDEGFDFVAVDGMQRDILDPYFCHPGWPDCEPPRQLYPSRTQELLNTLEKTGTLGWLSGDSLIRDMNWEDRIQFADNYNKVLPNLDQKLSTYFAIGGQFTVIFGLIRNGLHIEQTDLIRTCEITALAMRQTSIKLYEIYVCADGSMESASVQTVKAPTVLQRDFPELERQAAAMRSKIVLL